jgi:hypothetical protein
MITSLVRPSVEVGDILRACGEDYAARHPVSAGQAAVLRRLASCRTAALGGHVDACVGCGYSSATASIPPVPQAASSIVRTMPFFTSRSRSGANSRFTISRMTSRGVKWSPAVSFAASLNRR